MIGFVLFTNVFIIFLLTLVIVYMFKIREQQKEISYSLRCLRLDIYDALDWVEYEIPDDAELDRSD